MYQHQTRQTHYLQYQCHISRPATDYINIIQDIPASHTNVVHLVHDSYCIVTFGRPINYCINVTHVRSSTYTYIDENTWEKEALKFLKKGKGPDLAHWCRAACCVSGRLLAQGCLEWWRVPGAEAASLGTDQSAHRMHLQCLALLKATKWRQTTLLQVSSSLQDWPK